MQSEQVNMNLTSKPGKAAASNEEKQVLRRKKLQHWRERRQQQLLQERDKTAAKPRWVSSWRGKKVQRAPAPATPPPSSLASPRARASRPSGIPRPSIYRKEGRPENAAGSRADVSAPRGVLEEIRTEEQNAGMNAAVARGSGVQKNEEISRSTPSDSHVIRHTHGDENVIDVIDPDLVQPSCSSSSRGQGGSAGSASISSASSANVEETLRMMSSDLEAEVFHREVVKQEQEKLRRKLVVQHGEEMERLRRKLVAQHGEEMERLRCKLVAQHRDEMERLRWEHAKEKVQRAPAPATPPPSSPAPPKTGASLSSGIMRPSASPDLQQQPSQVQRAPAPATPPPCSPAPPKTGASLPSCILRPSASPDLQQQPSQKVQRAPAPAIPPPSSPAPPKTGASLSSGIMRPSASPDLQQQPSQKVQRAPAPATPPPSSPAPPKTGASSGTMPEGFDVRSRRSPCIWVWTDNRLRPRSPPRTLSPAERDSECPRERTTATSSAAGDRAPRPVVSHAGPSTVEEDS